MKQAVPDLVNEAYDVSDLKRMFLEPLGNFWYLYVLFLLYLLGAVTRPPKWQLRWLLLPAGIAVVAADMHLDWTNLTLFRILYHFLFFAAGCCLCRRKWLLKSDKLLGIAAMYLSVAAFFYCFRYTRTWYANWRVIIAMSVSVVLLQLFYRFLICSMITSQLYFHVLHFLSRNHLLILGIEFNLSNCNAFQDRFSIDTFHKIYLLSPHSY